MKKFVSISSAAAVTFAATVPLPALAAANPEQNEANNLQDQLKDNQATTAEEASATSLDQLQISGTSRLGRINDAEVLLYEVPGEEASAQEIGADYVNKSYYIAKQTVIDGTAYYELQNSAASDAETIGWAKAANTESFQYEKLTAFDADSVLLIGGAKLYMEQPWADESLLADDVETGTDKAYEVKEAAKVGDDTWYGIEADKSEDILWVAASQTKEVDQKKQPKQDVVQTEKADKPATVQRITPPEDKGYTVARSAKVIAPVESKTSRLGQIASANTAIYKEIGNESTSFKAGTTYTQTAYYIKLQAKHGDKTYYLISNSPSSSKGTIGWVDAANIKTYTHAGVDRDKKFLRFKGTGVAYTRAWGGQKLLVGNLSAHKGQAFTVNLTEKVGNNIWYRGTLDGRNVWVHSNHVEKAVTQSSVAATSRLGQLKSASALIYETAGEESTSKKATSKYTQQAFYIKKQADVDGTRYYLISNRPSSTTGLIGWVKSSDLTSHVHKSFSKKKQTAYLKGTGVSYNRAWGGKKNLIHTNLSAHKGSTFQINLVETVGANKWYRGILDGRQVWIHGNHISLVGQTSGSSTEKEVTRTYADYTKSLQQMVDMQMAKNPQTDKQYALWISGDAFKSIKNGKGTVKSAYNIRRGPGVSYGIQRTAKAGDVLPIMASQDVGGITWYQVGVRSGWGTAERKDVEYYMDPANFLANLQTSLQFADLSSSAGLDAAEVNEKILKGKGILEGRAADFIEAGRQYGVNEVYLISHALLETGNGTSALANGNEYKKTGVTVYNMYGIGAFDATALQSGIERAYNEGWTTPRAAIIGGAKWIADGYISKGQNTLYKMRWDVDYADKNNSVWHQYATDIGWAAKQTGRMNNLYSLIDNYKIDLIIPRFK